MKSVLITGGSSGIGAATAHAAAKAGWFVFIGYATGKSRAETIELEIKKSGGRAKAVQVVLGDLATIKTCINTITTETGNLNALVLCGGPAPSLESFIRTGSADIGNHLNKSVLGNYELIINIWNEFFKKSKEGHLVAVLSAASEAHPWPNMSSYVVGKRALQALVECAVAELGNRGLRASLVFPDYTETAMLTNQAPLIVEMAREKQKNKRFLKPAEVAEEILKCLEKSNDREYISTHSISA